MLLLFKYLQHIPGADHLLVEGPAFKCEINFTNLLNTIFYKDTIQIYFITQKCTIKLHWNYEFFISVIYESEWLYLPNVQCAQKCDSCTAVEQINI